MLPGGGIVIPSWRPTSGGYSKEDTQTPDEVQTATSLASKGGLSQDNYLDVMIEKANSGNTAALDWLVNYWATKESEKTARDWTAQREDTAYQRLNEDLRKAGISPYVLSGATPMVSNSTGKSFSGSDMTSLENNKRTSGAANAKASLTAIGIILAALIRLL